MNTLSEEDFERREKLQEKIDSLNRKESIEMGKILVTNGGKYSVDARGSLMFDLISQSTELIDEMIIYADKCVKIQKNRKENIDTEYNEIRQRLDERNQLAMVKRKTRTKKQTE